MSHRPLITLTTDFGLQDPFVGIMKGVIAGICPNAQVMDITHAIESFSVLDGALAIWQAWRYFPAATVHTIVVDPGVGSERLSLLARFGEQWFIAPDNGVLTLVERETAHGGGVAEFRQIKNPAYMLPQQSSTFHGRDIFAPAAAHLAAQVERSKVDADSFGSRMEKIVQLPIPEPVHNPDGHIEGTILKNDKFGNLLTNIAAADLVNGIQGCEIEIGARRITRTARFFGEVEPGVLFAILGSSGWLEIAMNRGSAQEETGVQPGTKLRFTSK